MIRDIIGTWEITLTDKGRDASAGRIAFQDLDGKVVVNDADPDSAGRPARVELDGETFRFELGSAGSSRGNIHHSYEIVLRGPDMFGGTRRRGMLARTPVTGQRVLDELRAEPAAAAPHASTADPSTPLVPLPASVAEAKARAAEAAERAALAAAEAAAALAEAEAVAALDAARRAAEQVTMARAAVQPQHAVSPSARPLVSPEVLADLPAPTQAPAFVPLAPSANDSAAAGASRTRLLPITHRLTFGDRTVLAAVAFPGVFVWGGSFAASEYRLREAGWTVTAITTDDVLEIDEPQLQHAATVRDSLVA